MSSAKAAETKNQSTTVEMGLPATMEWTWTLKSEWLKIFSLGRTWFMSVIPIIQEVQAGGSRVLGLPRQK
jgi:hypothetical protein